MPLARSASRSPGSAPTRTMATGSRPSRPPVTVKRSVASATAAARDGLVRQRVERGEVGEGQPEARRREAQTLEVLVHGEGTAVIDAQRLEGRQPAQQTLVVGMDDRQVRVDEAASQDGQGERGRRSHRASADPGGRADGVEEWSGLDPGLFDLGRRLGVPDHPATDPQVDAALGDGEGPDGQGEVEVPVRPERAEGAHRGAATDRLEGCDVVEGRDLRRSRHRSAGEHRAQRLGPGDPLAQATLDERDEMLDAGHRADAHELGPANAAGLADAAQVIALQVHDHDVLGGVLAGGAQGFRSPARAGALDGHRPDPPAAPGQEELR